VSSLWRRLQQEVQQSADRVRTMETRSVLGPSARSEAGRNIDELYRLQRVIDDLIDAEIIRGHKHGAGWSNLGSSRQQAYQRHKRAMARKQALTKEPRR
jgi:hypothetical protein